MGRRETGVKKQAKDLNMNSKKRQATIRLREEIIAKKQIQLVKVFDTNEHEDYKDVVLGKWQNKKIVLRIGERRPINFFRDGYRGKYFVVPRLYLSSCKYNYEIEEYLAGKLFCDLLAKPKYNKIAFDNRWLATLIKAHWEFQVVVKNTRINKIVSSRKKAGKFLKPALAEIKNQNKEKVKFIINSDKYDFFWQKLYPCKWKYSADNLLAMPNKKIGFIDLAGISMRHWGYDLGWLIWPQWFAFSQDDYKQVEKHWQYL